MSLEIQDYPMHCCGMAMAAGFPGLYGITDEHSGRYIDPVDEKEKYKAAWDAIFQKIEDHQRAHRRNLVVISLSDQQRQAREQVLQRGFKAILSFFNPNSDHNVILYSKVLWEDQESYRAERDSGEYKVPTPTGQWTQAHHVPANLLDTLG